MRSREAYKKTVAVLTRIRTNSSIKVQDVSIVCMTVFIILCFVQSKIKIERTACQNEKTKKENIFYALTNLLYYGIQSITLFDINRILSRLIHFDS